MGNSITEKLSNVQTITEKLSNLQNITQNFRNLQNITENFRNITFFHTKFAAICKILLKISVIFLFITEKLCQYDTNYGISLS